MAGKSQNLLKDKLLVCHWKNPATGSALGQIFTCFCILGEDKLTGAVLLTYGVWIKGTLCKYMKLSSSSEPDFGFLLIGVGSFIILVGCLGCCCTIQAHPFFMYMYSSLLFVVVIIDLSAGIILHLYRDQIEQGFQSGLLEVMQKYEEDSNKELTLLFDSVQKKLACCGISNYTDWFQTRTSTKQLTPSVPKSCCRVNVKTCRYRDMAPNGFITSDINTEGCLSLLALLADDVVGHIGNISLGFSFFQILGAILAFCLAKSSDRSTYETIK